MSQEIDDIRHQRELIYLATRRLYELDKQAIILGITVDPRILMEREDLHKEIASCKSKLIELISERIKLLDAQLAATTDSDKYKRLQTERNGLYLECERYKRDLKRKGQAEEPVSETESETETEMTSVPLSQQQPIRNRVDAHAEQLDDLDDRVRAVEREQRATRGVLAQLRVDFAQTSVGQRWIIAILGVIALGVGGNLWFLVQLSIQVAARLPH